MLVLSRRQGEKFKIGSSVVVEVLATGSQVKLGIEAPRHWPVVRSELASNSAHQDKFPHDLEKAGLIAAELQLAMAKGDWARFHELASGARERLTDDTVSLTDLVGDFLAHKLERQGIFTLEQLAKRDSRELMHETDGLGVVTMDRLSSALVEHMGITGWWEE